MLSSNSRQQEETKAERKIVKRNNKNVCYKYTRTELLEEECAQPKKKAGQDHSGDQKSRQ